MFNTALISEIDTMLSSMSNEKLVEYKDKLCKECQDLAKEYIEWSHDEAPEWRESVKARYEMKKALIERCLVIENMNANQNRNVGRYIDLRKTS